MGTDTARYQSPFSSQEFLILREKVLALHPRLSKAKRVELLNLLARIYLDGYDGGTSDTVENW